MADRFPLIIDSVDQQIQELSSGDNLDLASSGVVNANLVHSSGVNVGVVTATKFKGDGSELENLPASGGTLEATASGTLADGDTTIINTDGTVSAAGLEESGWIATLGGAGPERSYGIATDSSGNIYVSGYSDVNTYDILVVKYNSSGGIEWQRTLGTATGFDYLGGITIDSSSNVYVTASCEGGLGGDDLYIAKLNGSSGSTIWHRVIGSSNPQVGHGVAVDSSGNVYIAGQAFSSSNSWDWLIAKYNSSGTIQWQKTLGGSDRDEVNQSSAVVDSSGNLYIAGHTRSQGAGHSDLLIIKFNTLGVIQWQRTLGLVNSDQAKGIALDSSGNVYVVGYENGQGQMIIAKYNNSGTIQWQRYLDGGSSEGGFGIVIDSSDNIYVNGVTRSETNGNQNFIIVKYNTSGDVQWQRYLGGTNHDYGYKIATDNSGSIYISGYTYSSGAGGDDWLVAKLPADGSGIGTYGSYTYAASTLTSGTSSLTPGTSSFTPSNSNFTEQEASLNNNVSNLTPNITSMASTNLTAENFIGISNGAYADGETATIQIAGAVDDAQSGLTPGQKYYVQNDGTLSETADSPSVLAGTAVAATKLIIG